MYSDSNIGTKFSLISKLKYTQRFIYVLNTNTTPQHSKEIINLFFLTSTNVKDCNNEPNLEIWCKEYKGVVIPLKVGDVASKYHPVLIIGWAFLKTLELGQFKSHLKWRRL